MRIFASLVAVWFGFVTIQPLYAAPCPQHQPALAELAGGPAAAHASAALPGHEMSGGAMGDMPGMPSGHGGSHRCHCMGVCCGAAPVAVMPQATQWLPAAPAAQTSVATRVAVTLARLPQADHSLPFATAPPAALLV